jgi:Tfp pilus assembly protein PilF
LDPADVEIFSNLGLVSLRANRTDVASEALLSALTLDPRRTSSWIPMAELYLLKSDEENAIRCILLGYEFSANKEKSQVFFQEKAASAEREIIRQIYATALQRIKSVEDHQ